MHALGIEAVTKFRGEGTQAPPLDGKAVAEHMGTEMQPFLETHFASAS